MRTAIFLAFLVLGASAQYNPYLKFYANDGQVKIGRTNVFTMETTDLYRAYGWWQPFASFQKTAPWKIDRATMEIVPDVLSWYCTWSYVVGNPFQGWLPVYFDFGYSPRVYPRLTLPNAPTLIGIRFHAQCICGPGTFYDSNAPVSFIIRS